MRSIENLLAEQQKQSWFMLVAGVTLGCVGFHFLMARPMAREMEQMQVNLAQVDQRMQDLVGTRGEVWEANSLLSSLKAQQGQIEDARIALQGIRELRNDVVEESARNGEVSKTLEGVVELQSRILSQEAVTTRAGNSFERMKSLQDAMAAQLETNKAATATLEELVAMKEELRRQTEQLEQSRQALTGLIELAQQLRTETNGIVAARESLSGLADLKTGLVSAATELETAQAVSDQLISLENRLAQGGSDVELATEHAEGLIVLGQKLGQESLNPTMARQNLDGLLQIEQHLQGETKSIADAVQALDVINGFRDEFVSQIQLLGEMRRSLMEISLMEPTMAKVSQMMKPLTELGNLRRLSDDELRHAARMILDGRTATRLSKSESQPQTLRPTGSSTEGLVPTPDDLE